MTGKIDLGCTSGQFDLLERAAVRAEGGAPGVVLGRSRPAPASISASAKSRNLAGGRCADLAASSRASSHDNTPFDGSYDESSSRYAAHAVGFSHSLTVIARRFGASSPAASASHATRATCSTLGLRPEQLGQIVQRPVPVSCHETGKPRFDLFNVHQVPVRPEGLPLEADLQAVVVRVPLVLRPAPAVDQDVLGHEVRHHRYRVHARQLPSSV